MPMTDKNFKQLFKFSEQHLGIPGFLGVEDVTNPPSNALPADDNADWNSAIIAREKNTVALDIRSYDSEDGRKKTFEHILGNTNRYELSDKSIEKLRSYLYSVSALAHNYQHGGLTDSQTNQIFEVAEALVKAQKIEKNSSKLGYLYNDLYLAKAMQEQKAGNHWGSAINQQIGHYLGKRQPSGGAGFQALTAAFSTFRLGHAASAAMGFLVAEEMHLSTEHFEFARINRIKSLRLAGEHQNARQLITKSINVKGISDEFHLELIWEEMLLNAISTGDFAPIFSMTLRGKPHYQPGYLLEAYFWARGMSSQSFIKRLPKLATIKKMGGAFLLRNSPQTVLFEAAFVLDECYENSVPLELRLANAARVISSLKKIVGFDSEMLVLMGFGRWFHRFHQQYLAAMAVNEYRSLSLTASTGRTDDCLRLAEDLKTDAWGRFIPTSRMEAFQSTGTQTSMIVSPLSRAFEMSKLTLSIAANLAATKLKTITMSPEQTDQAMSEYFSKVGTMVVRNLGKLKGPLMKVAQGLSYLPSYIPAEVKEEITKLQRSAQPLAGDITLKIAEAEYRRPINEIFAEWSHEPFAAGSIGQVHLARLKDGKRVAVKVMYPNIAEMIESDLRAIRLILPFTRKMFPHFDLKRITEEYRILLLRECDYTNEAANQERFREHFKSNPNIIVPEVYLKYSTSKVLVSEYVEGQTIKEFIQSSNQEERNRASEILFESSYGAMANLGFFNADPHPGNYLFVDGKVVFLDFGFVKEWPGRMRDLVQKLHFAVLNNEFDDFKKLAIDIGWIGDVKNYNFEYQFEVARVYNSAPYLYDRPFKFTESHVREEIEAMVTLNPNARLSSYPIDLIAIDRLTWGLNSILAQLEGEANYYQIMKRLMGDPEVYRNKKAG